jgi:hypothetical protein
LVRVQAGPFRVYSRLVSRYQSKYMIEMGENGPRRPAEEAEDAGIDEHCKARPDCNGTQIRDDHYNTWQTGRRRLKCISCDELVNVREPLF